MGHRPKGRPICQNDVLSPTKIFLVLMSKNRRWVLNCRIGVSADNILKLSVCNCSRLNHRRQINEDEVGLKQVLFSAVS